MNRILPAVTVSLFLIGCAPPESPAVTSQPINNSAELISSYCEPLGSREALSLHSRRALRVELVLLKDAGVDIGDTGRKILQEGYVACPKRT